MSQGEGGMVPDFAEWADDAGRCRAGKVLRVRLRKMPTPYGKVLKGGKR